MKSEKIDFSKGNGLVPVIIQDNSTGIVLMLGYMNEEAFNKTQKEKRVTFYSRSKKRLWTKGETSGNFLEVIDIAHDCDHDSLLIKVKPQGIVCHKGLDSCFSEDNNYKNFNFIHHLQEIIRDRRINPTPNSYTSSLFEQGVNKIAQKVGEEAVELILESKDDNLHLFKNEAADLIYHFLVLLEEKNVDLSEIINLLEQRHHPAE